MFRSVARAGILSTLAIATVALPATGFVGPQNSLSLPTKIIASPAAEDSWVESATPAAERAVALDRVATAASRLRIRTPLEILTCEHVESANGERTVTEQTPIMWPLQRGTFSFASPFGMRFHPVLGTQSLHGGIDLAGPAGTPIYAASDGVVVDAHPANGYGFWVRIRHQYPSGEVYYTGYAHMYPGQVSVVEGQQVHAGDQIARIGSNGWSTGPHLHFEVHDANDTRIDPAQWLNDHHALQPGESCD